MSISVTSILIVVALVILAILFDKYVLKPNVHNVILYVRNFLYGVASVLSGKFLSSSFGHYIDNQLVALLLPSVLTFIMMRMFFGLFFDGVYRIRRFALRLAFIFIVCYGLYWFFVK